MSIPEPRPLTMEPAVDLRAALANRPPRVSSVSTQTPAVEPEPQQAPTKPKKNYPNYAVVDVETTGFSSRDEIVEISVVLLDHDGDHGNWEITGVYSTLVDPVLKSTNVDNEASGIHGITKNLLKKTIAPHFKQVAPFFASIMHGRKLVGHNINDFDAEKLQEAYNRAGYRKIAVGRGAIKSEWIDTYNTMKRLPLWDNMPNKKLDSLVSSYKVKNHHAHSAVSDALALAAAFIHMMEEPKVRQRVHAYYREVFVDTIGKGAPMNLEFVRLKPRYALPEQLDPATTIDNMSSELVAVYPNIPSAPRGRSNGRKSNSSKGLSSINGNTQVLSEEDKLGAAGVTCILFGVMSLVFPFIPMISGVTLFICGIAVTSKRPGTLGGAIVGALGALVAIMICTFSG